MGEYTVDHFRMQAAGPPIVHGNGFIQLGLLPADNSSPFGEGARRLHVWHPECPSQKQYSGIHDHRFGFESEVIRGVLVNRTWRQAPGIAYHIYRPGRGDYFLENEWQLYATGETCSLHGGRDFAYSAGWNYSTRPGELHDSIPSTPMVATIMRKTLVDTHRMARVLCLAGREPDNSFMRDGWSPTFLWKLIEEVLKS